LGGVVGVVPVVASVFEGGGGGGLAAGFGSEVPSDPEQVRPAS
jgi:hypothetical protein